MARPLSLRRAVHLLEQAEQKAFQAGDFLASRSMVEEVLRRRVTSSNPAFLRTIESRAFSLMGWLEHNSGNYARAYRFFSLAEQWAKDTDARSREIAHLTLRRAHSIGKLDAKRGASILRRVSEVGRGEVGAALQAEYWRRYAEIEEDLVRSHVVRPENLIDLIELHGRVIGPLSEQSEQFDLAGNCEDSRARYGTQLLEDGIRWSVLEIEKRLTRARALLSQSKNVNTLYLHHVDEFRYLFLTGETQGAEVAYGNAIRLKLQFGLSAGPLNEVNKAISKKYDK